MAALTEISQKMTGRRTGTFAFVGATVIDGTGKPPIPNATVVTSNGKIVAVGPSAQVKIPADAQRIDVAGKYIIPGLWDMHAHYEQVEWGPIYLAAGVTTVRDVGNEYDFITQVRNAVNSGKALGPHMLLAGIVDGDGPYAVGITRVNSPADAQMWVTRYHDSGFQQIKIYSSVKPDNVKAICADTHKVRMTVTGHIPNGMNAYEGVDDGKSFLIEE
jgi:cytosine/adenosine deaminase-related metal-dependent hydrolase